MSPGHGSNGPVGRRHSGPDARTPAPPLVLASASQRRAEVLRALGLDFVVDPPRIPEEAEPGESPQALVERLAREKAGEVARRHRGALVVGGDTVVVVDGTVLGKPRDPEHAVEMLLALQGRSHTVATGLALVAPEKERSGVDETVVWLRPFDREVARTYVSTGEPLDKAGAYGIQGRGGALVRRVEGDYFTVMGFPVALFVDLLERLRLRYDFGSLRANPRAEGS